jgi:energy-coupling factor transport system substrate-specific component
MQSKNFFITFSAICIAINLILGTVVQLFKIPLIFLDTVGTFFGAVLLGPWYGALIGLFTNVIQGVITNPKDIPFALVNVAIGIIVGFIARKFKFNYVTAFITGLIISVVAPLIGTPIAIWIYGGITGGGNDFIFLWLVKSGQDIFTAAFIPRITGNFVDKIFTALLVAFLFTRLPKDMLAKGNNPFYKLKIKE